MSEKGRAWVLKAEMEKVWEGKVGRVEESGGELREEVVRVGVRKESKYERLKDGGGM